MKAKLIPGIPLQRDGAYHDTESQKDFGTSEMAEAKFALLKERFFSINQWESYCGSGSADFKLYDTAGSVITRYPKAGDFMKIDIPGPGDFENHGFDWVEIISISNQFLKKDELESFLIICRPSKSPLTDSKHIAHFYSPESTSSFRIARGLNFIRTGVYGRNETPNFSHTGFLNKIRNFLISVGGFVRITKIQWKSLADGLLDF